MCKCFVPVAVHVKWLGRQGDPAGKTSFFYFLETLKNSVKVILTADYW
jgi:hypothetical protein